MTDSAKTNDPWADCRDTLRHLVLESKEYIVFVDTSIDLDWKTSTSFDNRERKDSTQHHAILNRIALLESTPSDFLSDSIRLNFKRLLGEALVRSFDDDYDNAFQILDKAGSYLAARGLEKARIWYLKSAAQVAIGAAIVGLAVWLLRNWASPLLGEVALYSLLAIAGGALGALFSVIMRLGKAALDPAAGEELHASEGRFRVVGGMISACLASLCVYGGLILPVLGNDHRTHVGMLLAGFLAGGSERFAVSIIGRFEGANKESKKQSRSKSE